jgi:hypothetical protein
MFRDLLSEIHAHFNGPATPMHFPERIGDADELLRYIRTGYEALQDRAAELFP